MATMGEAAAEPRISLARANYCLLLLMLVQALNFLDRGVINILLDSIKKDMVLSDTVMGLLSGFAFVLFYSLFGIPVARLADNGNRKAIISLGLLVWSAMTALSGLAQNLTQLTLARFGVGIGESAGQAPAHSMISDYFPKEKRARALAIFQAGAYIGTFLGYFIGGWVNLYYGWRVAFAVAGLPGILLAVALYFTVAEPPRGQAERARRNAERASFAETMRFLLSQKSFVLTVLLAFHMGPIFAVVQATARLRMRAMATASFYLAVTVLGLGLAPLIIGMANDHLQPTHGALAIRYSLLLPAAATVFGGALFWWAAHYVERDMSRAEQPGG